MFESLTRFIPAMDRKESVFSGHPSLFDELYRFADEHKEYRLHEYGRVLEEYGLKWDDGDLRAADVSEMDAQGVVLFSLARVGQITSVKVSLMTLPKMVMSASGSKG